MVGSLIVAAALLQTPPQRASALLDAGVELSNRGRFHEAADKFVQALALDPNLAEAHYLLGLVRQQDGRADRAIQSFRAALKINPRYGEAQARVCELDAASAIDTAASDCRRAIQLNPNDPEPHFHLGVIQAKLANPDAAIQEFKTVLKLDPKFRGVKLELARVYLDSQNTDQAVPLLHEIAVTDSSARFLLGSALARKGDCAAAVPMLESAEETSQKHYILAGCYKKMNRATGAEAALAKVKQLREGADARMQAKHLAAVAHQKSQAGELDSAISNYRAALDLVQDPTIAIDLAVALLKKGEPEQVADLLAAQADPLARYQVALAYAKLGRLNDAITTLQLALREKPDFVEAWYQLGVASLAQGNPVEAERALSTATQLRPDEPAIRVAWAESLAKLGKTGQATAQRNLAARQPK